MMELQTKVSLVVSHLGALVALLSVVVWGIDHFNAGSTMPLDPFQNQLKLLAGLFGLCNAISLLFMSWVIMSFVGRRPAKESETTFWLFMVHMHAAVSYLTMYYYNDAAVMVAPNGRPVHILRHVTWCSSSSLLRLFLASFLCPPDKDVRPALYKTGFYQIWGVVACAYAGMNFTCVVSTIICTAVYAEQLIEVRQEIQAFRTKHDQSEKMSPWKAYEILYTITWLIFPVIFAADLAQMLTPAQIDYSYVAVDVAAKILVTLAVAQLYLGHQLHLAGLFQAIRMQAHDSRNLAHALGALLGEIKLKRLLTGVDCKMIEAYQHLLHMSFSNCLFLHASVADAQTQAVDVDAELDTILEVISHSHLRHESVYLKRGMVEGADSPAGRMYMPAGSLLQMVSNAALNALKHSSGGEVRLLSGRQGGMLVLVVSDTGEGMDERQIRKFFELEREPNEQASNVDGGFGLGGFSMRKACQELGGEVILESSLGHGTTLRFEIPYMGKDAAIRALPPGQQLNSVHANTDMQTESTQKQGRLRFLYIDDMRFMHTAFGHIARRAFPNCEIDFATNFDEADEFMTSMSDSEPYDALFTDHNLGVLQPSGMDFIRHVVNTRNVNKFSSTIVMITGALIPQIEIECQNIGAGLIIKPVKYTQLLDVYHKRHGTVSEGASNSTEVTVTATVKLSRARHRKQQRPKVRARSKTPPHSRTRSRTSSHL